MIVLDTNVLSEPMRPVPDPRVMAWLDAQDAHDLWITAIVAAELWAGVAKLPLASRRNGLQEQIEETLHEFEGRILAFDEDAAFVYGELVGPLMAKRMRYEVLDYQIAAITLVNGGALATRNLKHFVDTGVPLVNPWEA
jgi:predicted nucleic acid-binding protein